MRHWLPLLSSPSSLPSVTPPDHLCSCCWMPKPTWRVPCRTGWRTTRRPRCSWLLLQVRRRSVTSVRLHWGLLNTFCDQLTATPDGQREAGVQRNNQTSSFHRKLRAGEFAAGAGSRPHGGNDVPQRHLHRAAGRHELLQSGSSSRAQVGNTHTHTHTHTHSCWIIGTHSREDEQKIHKLSLLTLCVQHIILFVHKQHVHEFDSSSVELVWMNSYFCFYHPALKIKTAQPS